MPDPKFLKPWHGILREQVDWHPTVIEDACIGCGTCVTGCSRLVYRYDYEARKAVVADPLNCMVGCTTCANTCPTHAIQFPSLATIFALEGRPDVRHSVEDDLVSRRGQLEAVVPHRDRVVRLRLRRRELVNPRTLRLVLEPLETSDCLCQFIPGQYLELLPPAGERWLARAYSIGNAPRDDGSIELHVRRVDQGRMTEWLFDRTAEGATLLARGPRGHFTLRSAPETPLLFVAGGTGFAPIKALLEQQVAFSPARDMLLVWGSSSADELYDVALLQEWTTRAPALRVLIAVERGPLPSAAGARLTFVQGRVPEALQSETKSLKGRDAYLAGPPAMLGNVIDVLRKAGIPSDRVRVDSFGVG